MLAFIKRRKYWILIVGLLIVAFFVGRSYTSQLIDDRLRALLPEKTGGLYQMDFTDLSFEPFTGTVKLKGLEIIADRAVLEKMSEKPELVLDIEVERAKIDIDRVWTIYTEKDLVIDELRIENPVVEIMNFADTGLTLSKSSGDLYLAMANVLHKFSLSDLKVENAELNYSKNGGKGGTDLHFPDLSFELKGLLIDSTSAGDESRIFFTEEVSVQMKAQTFELPDGLHNLSFNGFMLSTVEELIAIEDISINPIDGRDTATNDHNIYDHSTPSVLLQGIDFEKAYNSNILQIGKVSITEPHYSGKHVVQSADTSDVTLPSNSIPELLAALFNELHLDTFLIERGGLDLVLPDSSDLVIEEMDLLATHIHIDTTTINSNRWKVDYNGVEFKLKGKHEFKAGSESIQLKEFHFSTFDSSLALVDVHLSSTEYEQFEELVFDTIALDGLQIKRFLENSYLKATNLVLNGPKIELDGVDLFTKTPRNDLYRSISPYLVAIDLDHLTVKNAVLRIRDNNGSNYEVDHLDLYLYDMLLDSNSAARADVLYARDIGFDLQKAKFEITEIGHSFKAREISCDGLKNRLRSWNVEVRPTNSSASNARVTTLDIPTLAVSGFDINRIVKQRSLMFSTIIARNAEVRTDGPPVLESKSGNGSRGLSRWSALGARKVDITGALVEVREDGVLKVKVQEGSVKGRGIKANSASLAKGKLMMRFDSLRYGLSQLDMTINEGKEHLSVGKTYADLAHQELHMQDIVYGPSSTGSNALRIYIPKVHATEFEPYLGHYTRSLDLGDITLNDMQLRYVSEGNTKNERKFELPEKLPAGGLFGLFDTLQAHSVNCEDAQIHFEKKGAGSSQIKAERTDLTIKNLFIGTRVGGDPWIDNIKIHAKNIEIDLPKQRSDLADLELDTRNGTLKLNGVSYKNKENKEQPKIQATAVRLDLEGFELHDLLAGKRLRAIAIEMDRPVLKVEGLRAGKTNKNGGETALIPKEIEFGGGALERISVDELIVNEGELLASYQNNEDQPIDLKDLEITITGIRGKNKFTSTPAKPLYFGGVSLSTGSYRRSLNNGMDVLKINGFKLNSANGGIELIDLSIKPTLTNSAYSRKLNAQVDVLDLEKANVEIAGLDLYAFLHRQDLVASRVEVSNTRIKIYKDKRLPFDGKLKPIPSTGLSEYNKVVDIRTLDMKNSFLQYDEISEIASEPGRVTLTKLNGHVENLTNKASRIEADRILLVRANAKLMDQAYVELDMDFDLHFAHQGLFTAEARVGAFNMHALDRFVAPHSLVSFRSGRADTIVMRMVADDNVSVGEMDFFYKGLKLDVIKTEDKTKGALFSGLFANAIIKTDNEFKGKSKMQPVYYERDKARSVMNFTVKSLLSGLISTISPAGYKSKIKKIEDPVLLEKMRQMGINQDEQVEDNNER